MSAMTVVACGRCGHTLGVAPLLPARDPWTSALLRTHRASGCDPDKPAPPRPFEAVDAGEPIGRFTGIERRGDTIVVTGELDAAAVKQLRDRGRRVEEVDEAEQSIDLCRIEDADPNDVSIDDLRAMARVVRSAGRINELVGTETEEGQDAAWEELDAALSAFRFGPPERGA